jgi:hypothetical protein
VELFPFSDNLKRYLDKVENETGMPVKIVTTDDLGIKGTRAAFNYHPEYIIVVLNSKETRLNVDLERSIAHEATHGYLLHKLGFCRAVFTPQTPDIIKKKANVLFSTVEDLVVNRIIQEQGFPPYGTEYILMIEREIMVASQGEDYGEKFYSQITSDLEFEDIIMVSRYILAWGFLKYYNLSNKVKYTLQKFLEVFSKAYPHHYPHAFRVEKIILQNDIFTASGECEAMKQIIKLWGFQDLVKPGIY